MLTSTVAFRLQNLCGEVQRTLPMRTISRPCRNVFMAFNSQSLAFTERVYTLETFLVWAIYLEVLCRSVLEAFGSLSAASVS